VSDDFSIVAKRLSDLTDVDCAVVLIGSAARGRRTENSDIDILFVATQTVSLLPVMPGYHIKFSSDAAFLDRLSTGEDFEAWCVRYGVTLVDRGVWDRIKESSANVWPRWDFKVAHGLRRLLVASNLSKLGDLEATREELVFVLCHIARGLLLKIGIFPLSRPELAAQVNDIGYPELADLHERLRNSENPSSKDISLGLLYSKRLLVHLDRGTYQRIAQEHSKIALSKDAKRAEFSASRNRSSRPKTK
jgi:predicted nucleotidyltransferase